MAPGENNGRSPEVAGEQDSPATELESLSPDITLELAGRTFTVREYRVIEGLEVSAMAERFIADIVDASRGGEFTFSHVRPIIGRHMSVVVDMVARSTGLEPSWIRALESREDVDTLLMTWFGVNARFFVHEVVSALRVERMEAISQAGTTSSPDSPKAASATSTSSPG